MVVVVLSGLIAATALAQGGPPPPAATPGALEPAVAPGYRTVLWEAHLAKVGEPFTTFVDALGTPVP